MGTYSYSASSRLPYVVGIDQIGSFGVVGTREYYFWFFGYVAKLPFDRKVPIDDDISHYLDAATSIP